MDVFTLHTSRATPRPAQFSRVENIEEVNVRNFFIRVYFSNLFIALFIRDTLLNIRLTLDLILLDIRFHEKSIVIYMFIIEIILVNSLESFHKKFLIYFLRGNEEPWNERMYHEIYYKLHIYILNLQSWLIAASRRPVQNSHVCKLWYALIEKSSHFDLNSWVSGGTKIQPGKVGNWRIFESNWLKFLSQNDSFFSFGV